MAKLLGGTRIYGTATIDTVLFVNGTTATNSTNTGVLQVIGGIGVGGGLYVGASVTATTFTAGTGLTSDPLFHSSGITRNGAQFHINAGGSGTSQPSITGGSGLIAGNNGVLDLYGGNAGNINLRTNTPYATVVVSSSATNSTITGALQVVGGIGIGGGGFFGGTVTATNFVGAFSGTITGTATTATNLAGGTTGSIPYQIGVSQTGFIGIGASGCVLQSNGTTATWVSPGSFSSNVSLATPTTTGVVFA